MKITQFVILVTVALATVLMAVPTLAQKNILDVDYRSIPGDFQNLLKTETAKWNFNFRQYDRMSAEQLWTDPNVIRNATEGLDTPGEAPTAIHVSCDDTGLTLLIFAGDPDLQETTRAGNTSRSTIEMFIEPGTSETTAIVPYYQMIIDMSNPKEECDIFDWLMEDREYRTLKGHVSAETRFLPNGCVMRLFVSWTPLFDRLPLDGGKNNIWRLSVIRWGAKGGGQTWGGTVHSHSGAGYIRFPDFTPAQKTAIRAQVLQTAWNDYHACLELPHYNPARVTPPENPLAAKVDHRSYMNYNEDFGFREYWLDKAVAERVALGNGIAGFGAMTQSAQETFYIEATDKLFNFRHDTSAAYREYMSTKLFEE